MDQMSSTPCLSAIVVVDYDAAWTAAFSSAEQRLAELLGPPVLAISHVGSTAVPGLAAKPKIDIDVVLKNEAAIPASIEVLKEAGYTFRGDKYGDGMWAFTTGRGSQGERVYLCAPGNATHQKRLFFRDHLRNHPEAAAAYGALKRRLAAEAENDWDRYTGGKGPFVAETVRRAAAAGIRPVAANRSAVTDAVLQDLEKPLTASARERLIEQMEDLPMVACIAPDGLAVAFASYTADARGDVDIRFSGVRRSWQRMGLSLALVEAAARTL